MFFFYCVYIEIFIYTSLCTYIYIFNHIKYLLVHLDVEVRDAQMQQAWLCLLTFLCFYFSSPITICLWYGLTGSIDECEGGEETYSQKPGQGEGWLIITIFNFWAKSIKCIAVSLPTCRFPCLHMAALSPRKSITSQWISRRQIRCAWR